VERPIRYVRGNFVYGREFVGDADLDDQCRRWLDEVANVRVHRTTQAVPRERFEADERAQLQPLAERAYHPLVLPAERTTRRTVVRPLFPVVPEVLVERRGLTSYQALAETGAGAVEVA